MKKNILLKIVLAFTLAFSVFMPLSSLNAQAASTITATVNIKSGYLNVHEKAMRDSKRVGKLKKGSKVTVTLKNKNGWSTIKYKKKKAYVMAKYLKFPITQAEYYEIAKVKGESLKKTTNTFNELLIAGDFETIANKSYEELENHIEAVSSYIEKNVKDEKNYQALITSYIDPAQAQLDRVYHERELFFALQDTNDLINNLNFDQARKRFDTVAENRELGEAKRNTNKLESLPAKTVSYLDGKTKELEDRFSFSYIEQMPEVEAWLNQRNSPFLPVTKFLNNQSEVYTHGVFTNNYSTDYIVDEEYEYDYQTTINLNKGNLKGKYNSFTAIFTLNEYWKTHEVGSGEIIATLYINGNEYKELRYGDAPIYIDLDITKMDKLRIGIIGEKMVGLVDAKLYRAK